MKEVISPMDIQMDELIEQLTSTGSMYEVENQTIEGIEYQIFKHLPQNLNALYQMGNQFAQQPFLIRNDSSLTFEETLTHVEKLAKILIEKFGLKKGDRVGLAMRNSPMWCLAFMAITIAGGIVVAMNSWWKSRELEFAMKDTLPTILFADNQRFKYLENYLNTTNIHTIIDYQTTEQVNGVSYIDNLLENNYLPTALLPDIQQEDDAVIFYTSGSTGTPKGALSTHRMLLTTLFSWGLTATAYSMLDNKDDDLTKNQLAVLVCLPLFHVTACYNTFLLSIAIGRKLVFLDKWDVDEAMNIIEKDKITHFIGVPTMSYELLHAEHRSNYDLSSLVDISGGGAARPASQVKEIHDAFNISLCTGYGLTETNALGCVNGGDNYLNKPTSVGKATFPTVQIKIIDEKHNALQPNEIGEILIKSASNIKGYWNNEAATKALFIDGWLITGDIGYLDEQGYLYIVDRKKDIVIRGGENISTLEVETSIAEHPLVKEVSVFGIPEERLGEILIAIVVTHNSKTLDAITIKNFLSENVAHYKVPANIIVMNDNLLRGATGKVDKLNIRKNYIQQNS